MLPRTWTDRGPALPNIDKWLYKLDGTTESPSHNINFDRYIYQTPTTGGATLILIGHLFRCRIAGLQ